MSTTGPIGMFDSGLGGLTVLRSLIDLLPHERIVYFGDTGRFPYGPKPPDELLAYSLEIAEVLCERGARVIVVACNSAASAALDTLREQLPVPVLGVVEPGVRAAVKASRTGRIGVIGTVGTIASGAYERVTSHIDASVTLTSAACPGFVEFVEAGDVDSPEVHVLAERLLAPVREAAVDTLVLGCTHYPLLARTIGAVMGPDVVLVSSADETALAVRDLVGVAPVASTSVEANEDLHSAPCSIPTLRSTASSPVATSTRFGISGRAFSARRSSTWRRGLGDREQADQEQAMELTVLGSSGSYGGPRGAACSGYLVREGDTAIWLDCGNGTFGHLQQHIAVEELTAVVITHEHPDHCVDVYGLHVLMKWGIHREGFPVYAPEGLEDHLGTLVGGDWGGAFDWHAIGDGDRERIGSLALRFSRTDHPPPTYAVELEGGGTQREGRGKRLVYTADTGPNWSVGAFAPGADLVLSEATYLHDEKPVEIHLSAREAGLAARDARAQRLMLTHLWPRVDARRTVEEGSDAFGESVTLAAPHLVTKI